MARIYLSPLIVDIRNKQKDTVFSKWKGINYIRSRVVPSNPKTDPQIAVREALAQLVVCWQDAYVTLHANQDEHAGGRNYSGFNKFIGDNVIKNRDGELLDICQEVGFTQLLTFAVGGGPQQGECQMVWTPTPVPALTSLVIHIRLAGEAGWSHKVKYAPATASPQTIAGLTPDTEYEAYGYFELETDPTGEDVGDDMSNTGTTGA